MSQFHIPDISQLGSILEEINDTYGEVNLYSNPFVRLAFGLDLDNSLAWYTSEDSTLKQAVASLKHRIGRPDQFELSVFDNLVLQHVEDYANHALELRLGIFNELSYDPNQRQEFNDPILETLFKNRESRFGQYVFESLSPEAISALTHYDGRIRTSVEGVVGQSKEFLSKPSIGQAIKQTASSISDTVRNRKDVTREDINQTAAELGEMFGEALSRKRPNYQPEAYQLLAVLQEKFGKNTDVSLIPSLERVVSEIIPGMDLNEYKAAMLTARPSFNYKPVLGGLATIMVLGGLFGGAQIVKAADGDDLPELNFVLDGVCDEYPDDFRLESFVGQDVPDAYAFYEVNSNSIIICTPKTIEGTDFVDLFFTHDDSVGPRYFIVKPGDFKRTYPHIVKDAGDDIIAPSHPVSSSDAVFGENSVEIIISRLDFEIGENEVPRVSHIRLNGSTNNLLYENKPSMKPLPMGINTGQSIGGNQSMDLHTIHRVPTNWTFEVLDQSRIILPVDIASGLDNPNNPGIYIFSKDVVSEAGLVQRVSYVSPDTSKTYCHVDFNSVTGFLSPGPDHSALLAYGKQIYKINSDCTTEPFANAFKYNTIIIPVDYHLDQGVLGVSQDSKRLFRFSNGEVTELDKELDIPEYQKIVSAIWGPDGKPVVWDAYVGKIFHGSENIYSHSEQRGFGALMLNPEDPTKLLYLQSGFTPRLQEIDLTKAKGSNTIAVGTAIDICGWNPNDFVPTPDGKQIISVDPAQGSVVHYDLVEDRFTTLSQGALSPALAVSPDGKIVHTMFSGCDGGYIKQYNLEDGTNNIITKLSDGTILPKMLIDMKMSHDGPIYVLGTQNRYTDEDINLYIFSQDGNIERTIPLPAGFRADALSITPEGVFMCENGGSCLSMDMDTGYGGKFSLGKSTMVQLTNATSDGKIYGTQMHDVKDSIGVLTSNRNLIQIDPNGRVSDLLHYPYVGEASFMSPSVVEYGDGRVGVTFTAAPHPTEVYTITSEGLGALIDNYESTGSAMDFSEFLSMTPPDGEEYILRLATGTGPDTWGNQTMVINGDLTVYAADPAGILRLQKETPANPISQ